MKLLIPEPCSQKWEEMFDLTEESKFCGVCTKEIVDFTLYSDRELRQSIQSSSGKICGKFTEDQLNRSLSGKEYHFPNLKAIVMTGLLLNSVADLNGQVEMTTPHEQSIAASDYSYVIIKGRINDTISPQLAGDLRVELNGFHLYCLPNSSGDFQFQVPGKSVPELISLTVRKGNAYKVYSDLNPNEFIDISVSLHPIYLDEDFINGLPMIGYVIVKPKWYQFGYKFRRLWNRIIH
jgi:hypothetical protein